MAKRNTTVGGVDVPAGTTVMVMNGAANRDPRQFENPGVLDIERTNARRHIAFGRGALQYPGAPLARAEAKVSLSESCSAPRTSGSPKSTTAAGQPVQLRADLHHCAA